MLNKYKTLLTIFALVAFFVSCISTFTFADDDREDRYEKQRRSDRYDNNSDYKKRSKRHDRNSDRDDDADNDRDSDSDDDDDVTVPAPIPTPDPTPVPTPDPSPVPTPDPTPVPTPDPTPNPLCSSCHSYPGTNTLPSRHPSIGGGTTTPAPTPVPIPDPAPVPTPDPIPAPLDGAALYDQNCASCHGQSNFGKNVPSGHIGGRVNLTQEEINAINAL